MSNKKNISKDESRRLISFLGYSFIINCNNITPAIEKNISKLFYNNRLFNNIFPLESNENISFEILSLLKDNRVEIFCSKRPQVSLLVKTDVALDVFESFKCNNTIQMVKVKQYLTKEKLNLIDTTFKLSYCFDNTYISTDKLTYITDKVNVNENSLSINKSKTTLLDKLKIEGVERNSAGYQFSFEKINFVSHYIDFTAKNLNTTLDLKIDMDDVNKIFYCFY